MGREATDRKPVADRTATAVRAVVGVLPDGEPLYAPFGTMVIAGPVAQCHLCGGWFRSVGAHLKAHGWGRADYREALGLERGQSLEGEDTRRRRAGAMRRRRTSDSAVRAGCRVGREMASSGELAWAAASAARGRRQPEQRRRKTLRTLASISPRARAEGTTRASVARLRDVADRVAAAAGYDCLGDLVRERVAAGSSLAGISRESGLHKDWLTRHLAKVDPAAAHDIAEAVSGPSPVRHDVKVQGRLRALGFDDVQAYLRWQHVGECRSIRSISLELGMSRQAVEAALCRHGIPITRHATTRERCRQRATGVATRFGHTDIHGYLADRRALGMSWRAIAAECGMHATWLRRRAGLRD